MREYSRLALCVLILALSLPAFAHDQPHPPANPQENAVPPTGEAQQKQANQSPTVLKTTTRLVIVDVIVSNNKGVAVTDLKQDDFTVTENGKPQHIRVFNFQQASSPSAVKPVTFASLPPGVFTNVPRYKADGPFNVLLIDMLNTSMLNQAYMRQEVIHFLEKLPADEPLAIYVLGSKLRLIQDFSSDPVALQEAVKSFKPSNPVLLDGQEAQQMFVQGQRQGPQQQLGLLELEQGIADAKIGLRVTSTVQALQSISRSLAAYPGRKNLIWVSEGFPFEINPLSLGTVNSVNNAPQVAEITNALTDAQVAIYPVDARGLDDGLPDLSVREPGLMDGTRYMAHIERNLAVLGSTHAAMDQLAEKTGGRAFYNRNDLGELVRKDMIDGSTYYTLGYYPDNKDWNGEFRKIKVKVDRSGVKLRHRAGYFASRPLLAAQHDAQTHLRMLNEALNADLPAATSLLFEARVVPPSAKTGNKVVVNFAIDPHALTFETRGDRQYAAVDCLVQIYSHGYPIKTEVSTMTTALTVQDYAGVMQSAFPCQNAFDLTPGKYLLRLGAIDNRSGLMGTTTARVDVSSPAADGASAPEKKE
jgi:VWFA-related protein